MFASTMRESLLLLLLAVASVACQALPPAGWAEGGAALVIPDARWTHPEGDPLTISATGEVRRDGKLLFLIDAAGRVFEENNEPIALLSPDGHVVGTDEEVLGRVGFRNASPPWDSVAWLRVGADGTLMLFGQRGQPVYAGQWKGCAGHATRTCTLVSHLLVLEAVKRYARDVAFQPRPFGVGVGLWY